ncbi:hypothetical protein [Oceanobacillus kapialis]|uniref:Uncharacterized protein n=1 Tax=Oceanobacillus kapialis TaxID=481353 RepID=A0ABW5Q4I3_9BACI
MYQLALLYLACVLAGFGLVNVPSSAIITEEIANILDLVGSIAIIIFGGAILYLGFKSLFNKK